MTKIYGPGPAPHGHNEDHYLNECQCNLCKVDRYRARLAEMGGGR